MINASHRSVTGFRLEVLETAGPGIPVILVHGNSTGAFMFAPLLRLELGKLHRAVAVSLPGHGSSDASAHPEHDYTIEGLGEALAELVRTYGFEQYALVGHSLGGHVLLENIERFPGARGLVMISAPPLSKQNVASVFQESHASRVLFARTMSDEDVDAFAEAMCKPERVNAADFDRLRQAIRDTDPNFRPALGACVAGGGISDEMAALRDTILPVAFLAGTHDQFLKASAYNELPSARVWAGGVVRFEGCGHALHYENAVGATRVICEFLAALR